MTTTTARRPRITVPAEAVRTREQILATDGLLVRAGQVWLTCWNCGGSGKYPSSCTPPGRCRLLCWAVRDKRVDAAYTAIDPMAGLVDKRGTPWADTYGRLPVPVDTYVKRQQAADRREYRRRVQWDIDAPVREAAEREAAGRREREAAERREREAAEQAQRDAERAVRMSHKHVGAIGERIELRVTVAAVKKFTTHDHFGREVSRRIVHYRDEAQNLLVQFCDWSPAAEGDVVTIRGTVKKHDVYNDEPQTIVQRVKVSTTTTGGQE